ncbi:MAG: hypothetical protein ACYDGN_00015 [Acidimicrobiales bacterium]
MSTTTVAEDIRERVRRAPRGSFIRPADLPGSRSAVLTILSRLHAAGGIVRVRNGLYWKGVSSRYGPGRPSLLEAAVSAAGSKGAGPAGWSAAQVLGFATQLPATPQVAVAGPAPTLEGVRFHRRSNAARRDLGFYEVALLEALRDFPRHSEVDMKAVARTVARLETEGKVRLAKVKRVAASEHSPALRRNLGAVSELLSRDTASE